uniref:Uncharacterized protein n=1 Tax=Anopheles quadriannulatus TaxID=34691 RepID=A0A182XQP3_ANOQN
MAARRRSPKSEPEVLTIKLLLCGANQCRCKCKSNASV